MLTPKNSLSDGAFGCSSASGTQLAGEAVKRFSFW